MVVSFPCLSCSSSMLMRLFFIWKRVYTCACHTGSVCTWSRYAFTYDRRYTPESMTGDPCQNLAKYFHLQRIESCTRQTFCSTGNKKTQPINMHPTTLLLCLAPLYIPPQHRCHWRTAPQKKKKEKVLHFNGRFFMQKGIIGFSARCQPSLL